MLYFNDLYEFLDPDDLFGKLTNDLTFTCVNVDVFYPDNIN